MATNDRPDPIRRLLDDRLPLTDRLRALEESKPLIARPAPSAAKSPEIPLLHFSVMSGEDFDREGASGKYSGIVCTIPPEKCDLLRVLELFNIHAPNKTVETYGGTRINTDLSFQLVNLIRPHEAPDRSITVVALCYTDSSGNRRPLDFRGGNFAEPFDSSKDPVFTALRPYGLTDNTQTAIVAAVGFAQKSALLAQKASRQQKGAGESRS